MTWKNSTVADGWLCAWLPLLTLPMFVVACRNLLAPWVFMWALSFAIYVGLKWLTWWRAHLQIEHLPWRSMAYLLAWPGMDADTFLSPNQPLARPMPSMWLAAISKMLAGVLLLWGLGRFIPQHEPLVRGWLGMLGLILLLHFGLFAVIALFWQNLGIAAEPIMQSPLRSTSLTEFWGKRWNLGFRDLAHDLIFQPTFRTLGPRTAGLLVFVVSGLIHDAVISLPARGGYGLPTLYFAIQGVGVTIERSRIGRALRLAQGVRGWIFMIVILAAPVFWLFHPPFVLRVILPFMRAIHAI